MEKDNADRVRRLMQGTDPVQFHVLDDPSC